MLKVRLLPLQTATGIISNKPTAPKNSEGNTEDRRSSLKQSFYIDVNIATIARHIVSGGLKRLGASLQGH